MSTAPLPDEDVSPVPLFIMVVMGLCVFALLYFLLGSLAVWGPAPFNLNDPHTNVKYELCATHDAKLTHGNLCVKDGVIIYTIQN